MTPWRWLALGAVLVGCAEKEVFIERKAEELYASGAAALKETKYVKAAKEFAEVERQHPYSDLALKAQLMSAYCYYLAGKYDDAIEGFNVFIQLHPSHDSIPYAYYMTGICYYEQIPIIERDQKVTAKAGDAFNEIVMRFPESPYAKDAKLKLSLVHDHLAAKEVSIARYYQENGNWLAAINRLRTVVDTYPTTSHIGEALHRMVESYVALGLYQEAKETAAVLGHNHKSSSWYQQSYQLLLSKGIAVVPSVANKTSPKELPKK